MRKPHVRHELRDSGLRCPITGERAYEPVRIYENALERFAARVRIFAAIVWRPATGPVYGERWTWRERFDSRTRVAIAWEVAGMLTEARP